SDDDCRNGRHQGGRSPMPTHFLSPPEFPPRIHLGRRTANPAVPKQSRIAFLAAEQRPPPDGHFSALARHSRRSPPPPLPSPAPSPWSQHPTASPLPCPSQPFATWSG